MNTEYRMQNAGEGIIKLVIGISILKTFWILFSVFFLQNFIFINLLICNLREI